MKRTTVFKTLCLLFVVLALELAARAYLRVSVGGSLLRPDRAIHAFYPELEGLTGRRIVADDETVDVLVLGGSVVNPHWSPVQPLIAERLSAVLRRPVRVHGLATPAHTSRDSLLKYKRLDRQRFDVVLVYHGINDSRANNASEDVFDADYGHYSWYRHLNALDRDGWLPFLATPYAARHVAISLGIRLGAVKVIPTSHPDAEARRQGMQVKTAGPFKENLAKILDLAEARGEPVLLMTFATHPVDDYSHERFESLQLDYTRHISPLRSWGSPEGVAAALEAHDRVIRELAAERGVILVDQQQLMPGERRYFNDICHLTVAGAQKFVDNIMPALLLLVAEEETP